MDPKTRLRMLAKFNYAAITAIKQVSFLEEHLQIDVSCKFVNYGESCAC